MSRWAHIYEASLASVQAWLPIIGALVSLRPEQSFIADSIPGLGACRSTFCKPERRRDAG